MRLFKKPFSVAPKDTVGQKIARGAKRLFGLTGPTHRGKPVAVKPGSHPGPTVRILTREEHIAHSIRELEKNPNFQGISEHILQNHARSLLQIRGANYDSHKGMITIPRRVFDALPQLDQTIIRQRLPKIVHIVEPEEIRARILRSKEANRRVS